MSRITAWGASDFVPAGDAAGFEADEGFDTFLAMDAPPEQVRTLMMTATIPLNNIFSLFFTFRIHQKKN